MADYSLGGDSSNSNLGVSLGSSGLGFNGNWSGSNDPEMGGAQGLHYGGIYGNDGNLSGGTGGLYSLYGNFWPSAITDPGIRGQLGLGGDSSTQGFFSTPSYNFMDNAPTFSTVGLTAPPPVTPSFDGAIGLKAPGSAKQTGLGLTGEDSGGGGFGDTEFGRMLKKLGLWGARQNKTGNKALGILGAGTALGEGNYGQALGTAASVAGVPGPVAGLLGLGVDAAQGKPVQDQIGRLGFRTAATTLGGMALGPVGALMGGSLADYADRHPASPQGPTGADAGKGGGGIERYTASPEVQRAIDALENASDKEKAQKDPVGALMGGLLGLYGVNRMRETSKDQARAMAEQNAQQQAALASLMSQVQGKAPSAPHVRQPNFGAISAKLDGMFGPKSGVASELRTQLERKDAAAGRRSQYGPREVQLMAELTRLRAQAEPGYMNAEVAAANAANQGAFSVFNAQQQARQQQLQQLLALQGSRGNANTAALASQYQAQAAADQRLQQTLATLYAAGRDTGAFSWIGDQVSNWWNGQ